MLYLVVNNDFHVDNLLRQKHNFERHDVCVITVPYKLTNNCCCLSDNIINIDTPYKFFKNITSIFLFKEAKKKVDEIKFISEDIVIFLTEYDPINQYIVYSAKKIGARTILLEEGIATYYNNISSSSYSFYSLAPKEMIKLVYLKFFLRFHFIDSYENGFLKLKDQYIDDLFLYRDLKLDRNIKHSILDSCSKKYENLDKTKCLFINQPLYISYLERDEYVKEISNVINNLIEMFEVVYFKFHPRDAGDVKIRLKEVFSNLRNVIVVEDRLDIGETVELYKPYFAISFFSDALFKLSQSGLNMIFLFNLIPKLADHPVLQSLSKVLYKMEYTPQNSLEGAINSNYKPVSSIHMSLNDAL